MISTQKTTLETLNNALEKSILPQDNSKKVIISEENETKKIQDTDTLIKNVNDLNGKIASIIGKNEETSKQLKTNIKKDEKTLKKSKDKWYNSGFGRWLANKSPNFIYNKKKKESLQTRIKENQTLINNLEEKIPKDKEFGNKREEVGRILQLTHKDTKGLNLENTTRGSISQNIIKHQTKLIAYTEIYKNAQKNIENIEEKSTEHTKNYAVNLRQESVVPIKEEGLSNTTIDTQKNEKQYVVLTRYVSKNKGKLRSIILDTETGIAYKGIRSGITGKIAIDDKSKTVINNDNLAIMSTDIPEVTSKEASKIIEDLKKLPKLYANQTNNIKNSIINGAAKTVINVAIEKHPENNNITLISNNKTKSATKKITPARPAPAIPIQSVSVEASPPTQEEIAIVADQQETMPIKDKTQQEGLTINFNGSSYNAYKEAGNIRWEADNVYYSQNEQDEHILYYDENNGEWLNYNHNQQISSQVMDTNDTNVQLQSEMVEIETPQEQIETPQEQPIIDKLKSALEKREGEKDINGDLVRPELGWNEVKNENSDLGYETEQDEGKEKEQLPTKKQEISTQKDVKRSALLSQIQGGYKLKKVESEKQSDKETVESEKQSDKETVESEKQSNKETNKVENKNSLHSMLETMKLQITKNRPSMDGNDPDDGYSSWDDEEKMESELPIKAPQTPPIAQDTSIAVGNGRY